MRTEQSNSDATHAVMFLLLVALSLVFPSSSAQEPAERTPEQAAAIAALSAELVARQQAIDNMESELGIYDPALIEAYSDLGALYEEIEDYSSAISLYTNALQVARISYGLVSETQLPVLDSLIDNNGKMDAWQEVDDLQHLRYHINDRLYEKIDPRYAVAITQFGNWRLRVLRENLLDLSSSGLGNVATDLSDLYGRAIANIESQNDAKPESVLQMIYGKTQVDISLARSVAATPFTYFQGTVSPYITQTVCRNVPNGRGQVVRQCSSVRRENPRYRQSQQQAKQFELARYTRVVVDSIDKLRSIRDRSTNLSREEREQLDSLIAQLETESGQLLRASRNPRLL
ncbi:MAG: tetratricopeptide repeat protein [Gammaproteobacteria bacterium]|nr:tetratricopeptide repeat protein [Gammaproteobacteria bacterium]